MFLLGGGGQGSEQTWCLLCAAEYQDRGDRVLLVRHDGRAAAAWRRGLADLSDFGLREERDIPGDLAERRAGTGERRGELDDPQPVGVPGQDWNRQSEFLP